MACVLHEFKRPPQGKQTNYLDGADPRQLNDVSNNSRPIVDHTVLNQVRIFQRRVSIAGSVNWFAKPDASVCNQSIVSIKLIEATANSPHGLIAPSPSDFPGRLAMVN